MATATDVPLEEEAYSFRMNPAALSRRWKYAVRMLEVRGWSVSALDKASQYKRLTYATRTLPDGTDQTMILLFYPARITKKGDKISSLDTGPVTSIMERAYKNRGIVGAALVSNAKNISMLLFKKLIYKVEPFHTDFFALNPFEHMHSPRYDILLENPTTVALADLPTIASNNPIVRYLGLGAGALIRTTHTNFLTKSPDDLSIVSQVNMVRDIDEGTMVQTAMQEEEGGEDLEDDDGMFDDTAEATGADAQPEDDEVVDMQGVDDLDHILPDF